MHVLRQEAVAISYPKRVDKHVASLILPSNFPQCIDPPEPANQKSRFRPAEVIGSDIPHNVETTAKFMSDRLDGGHKTGIIGRDQAKFGQQKGTGVQIIAIESRGKCLPFWIPGVFEYLLADAARDSAPIRRAFRQFEVVGNRL